MNFHPLADAFPLIDGPQFDELVSSVRANGLRHPIVTLDNMILDGRNRFRACEAAGVEPRFEEFSGSDPLAFVIDENLNRRHMNESQRAMAAAKLANLKQGQRPPYRSNMQICRSDPITIPKAAEKMNVSQRSVASARTVLQRGTPEEIRAIELGHSSVNTVADHIGRGLSVEERRNPKARQAKAVSARSETLRAKAALWSDLREALLKLGNLPAPADVAATLRNLSGDKAPRADLIATHVPVSINWLTEFINEWESSSSDAA